MLAAALLALLPASALPGAAAAGGPVAFVPYRAVYDLALDRAADFPPGTAVTGRLVMEFTGSHCTGYATAARFVTRTDAAEGEPHVTDARSTTFETTDGRFEFVNEVYVNDALIEHSDGTVERRADGAVITLTEPTDKTVALATDVVFPTEQLAKIIEAASAGKKFLPLDLYDGAEAGETIYETATVIGPSSTAVDDLGEDSPIRPAGFAGLRHWPLTIGYFDKKPGVDSTPAYVMSFVLYENGVGRALRIDYGDYAILGSLTQLKMLPVSACP